MAGLVPAIYVLLLKCRKKDVDARDKRGHDNREVIDSSEHALARDLRRHVVERRTFRTHQS
jgi:hypothetical protein